MTITTLLKMISKMRKKYAHSFHETVVKLKIIPTFNVSDRDYF